MIRIWLFNLAILFLDLVLRSGCFLCWRCPWWCRFRKVNISKAVTWHTNHVDISVYFLSRQMSDVIRWTEVYDFIRLREFLNTLVLRFDVLFRTPQQAFTICWSQKGVALTFLSKAHTLNVKLMAFILGYDLLSLEISQVNILLRCFNGVLVIETNVNERWSMWTLLLCLGWIYQSINNSLLCEIINHVSVIWRDQNLVKVRAFVICNCFNSLVPSTHLI